MGIHCSLSKNDAEMPKEEGFLLQKFAFGVRAAESGGNRTAWAGKKGGDQRPLAHHVEHFPRSSDPRGRRLPRQTPEGMNLRNLSRYLLAAFFIVAGANHFRDPATYLSMMPPWLPAHEALNFISGVAEIAGGIGILIPRTRRAAAIGLILLLIAIFPANLYLAIHGWPEMDIPRWVLIVRLPFQFLFIAWVVFSCPGLGISSFFKRVSPSISFLAKK
jgi:uncharacterized membrane protein